MPRAWLISRPQHFARVSFEVAPNLEFFEYMPVSRPTQHYARMDYDNQVGPAYARRAKQHQLPLPEPECLTEIKALRRLMLCSDILDDLRRCRLLPEH
jgi:hypothetical protein